MQAACTMKKRRAPATLSEVARAAGVGTTTVSRVINGGVRVSPKTLARVRRVIDELGYLPNQAARVLKGDRTRTVGLIIPSIADPFFSSCAEAAQEVARANGSLLIVTASHNDPHTEIENLKILLSHRVDGLIVAPANWRSETLRQHLDRLTLPVIAIDRPVENSRVASVVTNNCKGAQLATEHLIEHGYKRIACLTGESTLYTIQERVRGYRAAMEAAKLPVLLDTSVKDYKSTEYAIECLMAGANAPDALFTLKNSTTMFAFEALKKRSIAVPKTVALLGFDDFELASTLEPSISVVQQPVEEIGRVTAELLFDELLGRKLTHGRRMRQTMLETRLIRRASCGCAPA
jgi:LacI family transcriptional regulator